jgi:hypothetical protein
MSSAPDYLGQGSPDPGTLANNNILVEALRSALSSGEHAFTTVGPLLEEIIEEEAWRDRADRNGRRFRFEADRFLEFIAGPAPDGMSLALDDIRRYLGDASNPLRVTFEGLIDRGRGGPNNPFGRSGRPAPDINPNAIRVDSDTEETPDTIPLPPRDRTHEPQAGTSIGYAIRRLGRQRPDLLEKVKAGEMSANAAMILAGLRKPPIYLPRDTEGAGYVLAENFSADQFNDVCVAFMRAKDGVPRPKRRADS